MEYKRLTRYNGKVMREDCRNCSYGYNNVCNYKNKGTIYDVDEDCKQVMLNRLAELEDKIENGTLVERPPIKKGDRIWLIRKYWDYFEGRTKKEVVGRIVKRIFLNDDNSLTFSCLVIHKGKKLISIVKSTTFNKSWFLTKAEAEEKLKELKEV